MKHCLARTLFTVVLAAAAVAILDGCAALFLGGALVGGALVVTDRRTSGTMVDDEAIELKGASRLREALGDRGGVSVTSYNRVVLLTGEVTDAADKATAEQVVGRVDNVKSVVNELSIGFARSVVSRSKDAFTTSKVKASFIDAKDLFANSIKVVTANQVVYLMGRVTEREAARAADVARGVEGVQKVIRVFEIISETDLANTVPKPAPPTPPRP